VYYEKGTFYLFCTYVECLPDGPVMTTVLSTSTDLQHWSTPVELTPRDRRLNFSSPGNVVKVGEEYILCLQTYCRENGEKYGNENSRLYVMETDDFETFGPPRLLRVKGEVAVSDMGRMIDPYLLQDAKEPEKWWCFYKQNGVSMSYSRDLQHWTFVGSAAFGENVCVIPAKDGYRMFHSPHNGIGVADSTDCLHWRDTGTLLTLGQKDWLWAQGRITAGFVLDLTDDPTYGKYIMFFHGSLDETITFDNNANIGIAWSDDCVHWEYPR
jgi:hypothetical protein